MLPVTNNHFIADLKRTSRNGVHLPLLYEPGICRSQFVRSHGRLRPKRIGQDAVDVRCQLNKFHIAIVALLLKKHQ